MCPMGEPAKGALADDTAGLGVADQQARQVAVRAATATAGHRFLSLYGQLVHPVQPPLRLAVASNHPECGRLPPQCPIDATICNHRQTQPRMSNDRGGRRSTATMSLGTLAAC